MDRPRRFLEFLRTASRIHACFREIASARSLDSPNLEPAYNHVTIDGMAGSYTIGELAKAAHVATSTVRFYERRKLIKPTTRSAGNYRLYDEESLRRLQFVRSAQAAGFTLSDIALLLRFRDGDPAPCRKVQELTKNRLSRVTEQMKQLRVVEAMLTRWLEACGRTERTGRCGVLDNLSASSEACCRPSAKKPARQS